MSTKIEPGDVFVTVAPFTQETFTQWDEDGVTEVSAWRPGARAGVRSDFEGATLISNAEGGVEYHVVSVYQPAGFQTRVFYRRVFVSPSGLRFNGRKSRALRVTAISHFRKLIRGWPVKYEIEALTTEVPA